MTTSSIVFIRNRIYAGIELKGHLKLRKQSRIYPPPLAVEYPPLVVEYSPLLVVEYSPPPLLVKYSP